MEPRFVGKAVNSKITRNELMQALADKGKFDELYISTTQRAIEYYAEGKRRKFALKLHGDLAAFDLSVLLFSLPCHSIHTQRQDQLMSMKLVLTTRLGFKINSQRHIKRSPPSRPTTRLKSINGHPSKHSCSHEPWILTRRLAW